jgi:hypothetical protein
MRIPSTRQRRKMNQTAHHLVPQLMPDTPWAGPTLGTTPNLDDDLIREALQALVQRESARRLAALGGTEPALEAVPRRRSQATAGAISQRMS